jgi:hypothetical protein
MPPKYVKSVEEVIFERDRGRTWKLETNFR